jgi:hypothetical protein
MSLETPTRPRGLREVILLMCALTLVPLLWIEAIMLNSRNSGFALYGVFSALWLLVVWFLWQGRNWARTVIFFSACNSKHCLRTFCSASHCASA